MRTNNKKIITAVILALIVCAGLVWLYRMHVLRVGVPQAKFEIKLQGNTSEGWVSTGITEKNITDASAEMNNGNAIVLILLDIDGGDKFATLTANNIGKQAAVFIDDIIISAPTIQSQITGGELIISGNFSYDDAVSLSRTLKGTYFKPWLKPR